MKSMSGNAQFIKDSLQGFLQEKYPTITITVEKDATESDRWAIFFVEESFQDLYRLQRYYMIRPLIPDPFYEEHLQDTLWYELAPGETVEDLDYLDQETVDEIKEPILKILSQAKFFEKLDDLLAPPVKSVKPEVCRDDFRLTKSILNKLGFDEDEQFDICHVLMREGAFCDCEVLTQIHNQDSRMAKDLADKMRDSQCSRSSCHGCRGCG